MQMPRTGDANKKYKSRGQWGDLLAKTICGREKVETNLNKLNAFFRRQEKWSMDLKVQELSRSSLSLFLFLSFSLCNKTL